jgi:alpha-glucosidase
VDKALCFLLAMLAGVVAAACEPGDDDENAATDDDTGDDDDDAVDDDSGPDDDRWRLWKSPAGTLVISYDGRDLFELAYAERIAFAPRVTMLFGIFYHRQNDLAADRLTLGDWTDATTIELTHAEQVVGHLRFQIDDAEPLRATVTMNTSENRDGLRLYFTMADDDRFWGFGEQYNYVDFRGRSLAPWVSEQGLGRKPNGLIPPWGTFTTTYFPMPYFLDPQAGKGFLLTNTEYSKFDLGERDPTAWNLEVWNGKRLEFLVFPGPTPKDVVRQLTAEVGRPARTPPPWAFAGPWLAAQGGTEAVRARVQTAVDHDIPLTAVWVQDWLGLRDFGLENFGVKYHWLQDEELYPDLDLLIGELADQGIRFLGYFNPFVTPTYEHWATMTEQRMLIERPDGRPYQFLISTFVGSLVDVSDPNAIDYFQGYARRATTMGQKGWMCDFGEWLPFDTVIDDGPAPAYHNLYPTNWQRINRQVLEEAYPDGDWVMLTRSGFTGNHQVAQIVWAGDQEATWSPEDGLPTVVTAGLTIGLSGVPVFTHDIGGFSGGPRTKALFLRWTEFGAFTPVMRTHDGLKKLDNHHFDSDQETLDHFSFFARVHQALLPVWRHLAEESVDEGLPMIRHTVLVDPGWDQSYDAHQQWMIGDDILFVPVMEEGADTVTVRFPAGQWEHLVTGDPYDGRAVEQVETPLYFPAIFVRVGAWPNVVTAVRTLYEEQGRL